MLEEVQEATSRLAGFVARYPAYPHAELDRLRDADDGFARLDRQGQVYLDYTGGSLYPIALLERHFELLRGSVLGNPHSDSRPSKQATDEVEAVRHAIHRFWNASEEEWAVIFTANASHALRLVAEAYPFGPGGAFLHPFDNHNSVLGIREFARTKGVPEERITAVPLGPELGIDADLLARELKSPPRAAKLFAFPAQSNFSGVQHDLGWIERARAEGWDVLLDAAAFVPTNPLDLGVVRPDYVAVSFYKMFGYPTGVGALVARRDALAKLERPWFAGGTVEFGSVRQGRHRLTGPPEAFEDGTLDYANIPAVGFGLELLERVGMEALHDRVAALAGWLIEELLSLRHRTGRRLVEIYGPPGTEGRGGTLAMNFFDPSGHLISPLAVESQAVGRQISLRTGCFCNPGCGEMALGIPGELIAHCITKKNKAEYMACVARDEGAAGAVRVSLGLASSFRDVEAFADFARGFVE